MDFSDMSSLVETIVIPWAIKIALALAIFYVGRMVVGIVVNGVKKLLAIHARYLPENP